MRGPAEQWVPVLVDRGTVLALVCVALVLLGMLFAGFGGLGGPAARARA